MGTDSPASPIKPMKPMKKLVLTNKEFSEIKEEDGEGTAHNVTITKEAELEIDEPVTKKESKRSLMKVKDVQVLKLSSGKKEPKSA